MKKTIVVSVIILTIAACTNNNNQNSSSTVNTEEKNVQAEEKTQDPNVQKGLELTAKSDCMSCHKVDQPLNGPSLTAIAEKYPNNEKVIDSLADKIIKGGVGNWGQIPMTAHPDLSKEDAKLMVQYILSLKNNL